MMARPFYKKYLLLVLGIVALLQFSLVLAYWKLIDPYWSSREYRVVEVTSFPLLIRGALIDGYISHTAAEATKPLILVMGDSEPYGPFVEEQLTFARLLARNLPDHTVLNVSIKGARLVDIEKVIDSLERHGIHPEFILFDINFADFRNLGNMPGDNSHALPSIYIPIAPAIAAATFQGVQSVYHFRHGQTRLLPDTFNYMPLPRDAIPREPSPVFEESLRHVLNRLKHVGKNIVVYTAPFAIESFGHYGFDGAAFRKLAARYNGICRDIGVDCLDLSGTFPMDNFIDIIHLNRQGHAFMAQRLEEEILKNRDIPSQHEKSSG
jgi:hypothetical protein